MRLKAPQRRAQILEVAQKLFSRNGYARTTTAALADAAGVTEPILYRHFPSKRALFEAVLDDVNARIMAGWRAPALSGRPAAQQLDEVMESFPQRLHELRQELAVVHRALSESQAAAGVRSKLRAHYGEYLDFFRGVLTRGQKDGSVRRDLDPQDLAWCIVALGLSVSLLGPLRITGADEPAVAERLRTFCRRVLAT